MRVTVRRALLRDAEAIGSVAVRAWQVGYVDLMPPAFLDGLVVADRVDMWRRALRSPRPDRRILVADAAEAVTGFVAFGSAQDEQSGSDGELYALNVDPDRWGSGVGSALLTASHDGLAELGHRRATLWVLTGNDRARRFYERHGWSAEPVQRSADALGVTVLETRYTRALG